MNRFKPGQQVVCVHKGTWISHLGTIAYWPMPKFNEVVTVKCRHYKGILIEEYDFPETYHYLHEKWFEPLVSDEFLEAELNSIKVYEQI